MRYVIPWLVLAAVFAVGIGSLNWLTYYRLNARGVEAQAIVVELTPDAHGTVRVEYRVAGQAFREQMAPQEPNPPPGEIALGQALVVCYDPQQPESSVLGNPRPMLENETISVLLAALLFSTFVVVGWAAIRQKTKQNRPSRA